MAERWQRSCVGTAALVAVIAAVALGATSARAASPFTIDGRTQAQYPDVAVDGKGTAHVVWNEYVPLAGDWTRYCQIPRGQRGCNDVHGFRVSGDAIGRATRVLVPDADTVIVLSHRCCSNDYGVPSVDATFAWISRDGGKTFNWQGVIAGGVWPEAAVPGPGPFAVSMLSDLTTGGVRFQTAPLAGEEPQKSWAEVGAGQPALERGYGIGFVDPLTPIIAGATCCHGSDDGVYFRRFAGGTSYNSAGSWGPKTLVTHGDDAALTSLPTGRKGVHLMVREGEPGSRRYVDRRYDGQRFVNPTRVSEVGNPHFLTYFMDQGGRLHAIWMNGDDAMRHRVSEDGAKWNSAETLISREDNAFWLRGDAACDGGGMVVFDGNGQGPVRALPFGPARAVDCEQGGGGGGCVDSLRVGQSVQVEAEEGCLKRKGDTYTTSGDVRVNGIDLLVGSAKAGGAQVIIDRAERTLKTTEAVEAKVGNVVLGREKLGWKLPQGTGQIRDLAGNPAALNTSKFGSELLGLPVSGYVVPEITGLAKGELDARLALPSPFTNMLGGSSSAESTLRFDNARGLELGTGLKVDVKDSSIGIAGLAPFDLRFTGGTSTLYGKGELKLPVTDSGLTTEFQLKDGDFDFGKASLTPPTPIPVAPNVTLNRIDFFIQKGHGCDTPTRLAAGGRIVAFPAVVANAALLDLDPFTASYSFPIATCGQPGVFDLSGKGKLISLGHVNVNATYKTSGQFTFGAGTNFDLEAASASIDVNGGVDLKTAHFYALGQARARLFSFSLPGADVLVSSTGVAACGPAPPIPPPINPLDLLDSQGGFEYRWGGKFRIDWPSQCDFDLEELIPAELRAAKAPDGQAASRSASFKVPGGVDSVAVRIRGRDGAPGFVLTGPGGLRIEHGGGGQDPVANKSYEVFPAPSASLTNVEIKKPRTGSYTVADEPGKSEIAAVAYAPSLPKPRVRADVTGSGGKRVLTYRSRRIEGQSILFVEQGRGGVRAVIGRTKEPSGRLRFHPSPGPAGKRRVLAIVEERGTARAELPVATYKAPSDLPGKPRHLRLRRRGTKLLVTWRRAPRSKGYAVAWRLRDGRRGSTVVKKRRFKIRHVPGIDAGKVRVAGVRKDNVAGKVAKAKLKPKPKRRHHRRHHRGAGR